MISPRLRNCVDCTTIPSLLEDINCKLTDTAKAEYNNIIFELKKCGVSDAVFDLLHYKRILEYKYCNPEYANGYSISSVANRVKLLIHK